MFPVKTADQEGDAVVVGIVYWRVKAWTVVKFLANKIAPPKTLTLQTNLIIAIRFKLVSDKATIIKISFVFGQSSSSISTSSSTNDSAKFENRTWSFFARFAIFLKLKEYLESSANMFAILCS